MHPTPHTPSSSSSTLKQKTFRSLALTAARPAHRGGGRVCTRVGRAQPKLVRGREEAYSRGGGAQGWAAAATLVWTACVNCITCHSSWGQLMGCAFGKSLPKS